MDKRAKLLENLQICETQINSMRNSLKTLEVIMPREDKLKGGICSYGKTILDEGSKRPEVTILHWVKDDDFYAGPFNFVYDYDLYLWVRKFQQEHALSVDGQVGSKTWKGISKVLPAHILNKELKAFALSTHIELGSKQDAFGFREDDIGDGAGANFGTLQFNNQGSLKTLLTNCNQTALYSKYMADPKKYRDEVGDWLGSKEGRLGQWNYYKHLINDYIYPELEELPYMKDDPADATLALMIDLRIQNGTLFSPYRTPGSNDLRSRWDKRLGYVISWKDVLELIAAAKKKYSSISEVNKEVIIELINRVMEATKSYRDCRAVLAMYRARCSRAKYRDRVEIRKLLFVDGRAKIHGEILNLYSHFGLTY